MKENLVYDIMKNENKQIIEINESKHKSNKQTIQIELNEYMRYNP